MLVCWRILCCGTDPQLFIAEADRVLIDDGWLVIMRI